MQIRIILSRKELRYEKDVVESVKKSVKGFKPVYVRKYRNEDGGVRIYITFRRQTRKQ